MVKNIRETTLLNNDVEMPWFGLGTYQTSSGEGVQKAVTWALETGYCSIDTAAMYGNEAGIGTAIKESGLPRDQVFVTSKVWNSEQGYDQTMAAFETSLNKLGFDYLDLYLVHWPVAGKFKETWRALETLYAEERVRAIGVSNFLINHLEELFESADIVPAVNQVEFHPHLQQPELYEFCRENNIQLEAWSPLMKGKVLELPTLIEIGERYDKTPIQVTLRWMLQREIVTIPKSSKLQHIQSNAAVFDFALSDDEVAQINALDRHERVGPDPDNFDF